MVGFGMRALYTQIALAVVGGMLGAASARGVTYTTVAFSGQQAPGTGGEASFVGFFEPTINNLGAVAFQASIAGAGVSSANNRGIWSGDFNSLQLAAQRGSPAPGTAGLTFTGFNGAAINDSGVLGFNAQFLRSGSDVGYNGIWVGSPGALQATALGGERAPGTEEGVLFFAPRGGSLAEDGRVAFGSNLSGAASGTNSGVWAGIPGAVELVARRGSQAPGTEAGVVFGQLNISEPVVNEGGRMVFFASVSGPGVDESNWTGIWLGKPRELQLLVRGGAAAPGTPGGTIFRAIGGPSMNAGGDVAFLAELAGGGVDGSNDRGIWIGRENDLRLVVREGSQAPGLQAGVVFADQQMFEGPTGALATPALAESGSIAFMGNVGGPGVNQTNNQGIWAGKPDALQLIAREGDAPPGAGAGWVFGGAMSQHSLEDFAFMHMGANANGLVAFSATLRRIGSYETTEGMWMSDATGNLSLVAQVGELFDVGGGDLRRLAGFSSFLTVGGGPSGAFNSQGQLAFIAGFDDGSMGVFIAQIPEPVSGLWVSALMLVLGQRRLKRCRRCF